MLMIFENSAVAVVSGGASGLGRPPREALGHGRTGGGF